MKVSMFRRFLFLVTAALCLSLAGSSQTPPKKSALDKATLEAYVRHLFVMDKRIAITVSDPHPSADLPGFHGSRRPCLHGSAGPGLSISGFKRRL